MALKFCECWCWAEVNFKINLLWRTLWWLIAENLSHFLGNFAFFESSMTDSLFGPHWTNNWPPFAISGDYVDPLCTQICMLSWTCYGFCINLCGLSCTCWWFLDKISVIICSNLVISVSNLALKWNALFLLPKSFIGILVSRVIFNILVASLYRLWSAYL